ncbi:MAG TPA: DeoR/GlpR family DNA-binding transcription regulator [Solirubrobacteraceae bacterium]|nr:DeoR/GlpR family DNA-binding transcription regulator [Solirubrobacteraceae bacterium]
MTSPPTTRHTLPAQRRQEILQAVRAGATHVSDLAASFGVSEMTVRRDLRALARDGKIERVRGGALNAGAEPPFEEIEVERFEAKDRIGAAAAALIEDGQTVMIDIGTTTLQAARHLHGREITVVTTSLAVYEELVPDPGIELVLPGGVVRRNYRSLVGVLAEDTLRQLKADVCLLGTSGIDGGLGVWDSTMVEVPIKRTMIEASDCVVLLADGGKFASGGLVRVCDARALDHLVTDGPLPEGLQSAVDDNDIEVTIA